MSDIKLFESKKVRSYWDKDAEKWFFSVVDVVEVLTESVNPRDYWFKMKTRVASEDGVQLSTICRQLKLESSDGKKYLTDCADVETLLRIIQSVPSPKAEPFKQWLAKVGYERMQEISDPALGVDRARENWQKLGRSDKWIRQRMMGQETRNKLTDYWKESGVEKPDDFAKLTNIIHEEWTGIKISEHKKLKSLKTENLRDHMSEAELIFTALAELSTRNIAESVEAIGVTENANASKRGGAVAKRAKEDFEEQTGQKVITGENFLPLSDTPKKLNG